MSRKVPSLFALTALLGTLIGQRGTAQAPEAPPSAPPPTSISTDPVLGLPKLPDAPRSLFAPPSPAGGNCACLPGPYFEHDPLLDPPELPPPGWFASVDLGVDSVHIRDHVAFTNLPTGNYVAVPVAPLDWNFAGRIAAGCRLPSGFGELLVGYRFLGTEGSGQGFGPDGPAALHSRFDLNELDFDYLSREFSLWPCLDMNVHLGWRIDWIYFDSSAEEAPTVASANPLGIFERRLSNSYVGTGPHTGLELGRRFKDSGLWLGAGCDFAIELGRVRQGVFEVSNIAGNGGETWASSSQAVPEARFFVGIHWNPPTYSSFDVSLGYHYDYFWNPGRDSTFSAVAVTPTDTADVVDQGFFLRIGYRF